MACGTKHSNGSTGGSEDAVVVKHNHTQNAHNHFPDNTGNRGFVTNVKSSGIGEHKVKIDSSSGYYGPTIQSTDNWWSVQDTEYTTATNKENGVDGTGKNMPPFLTVYMWKRIA